MASAPRDGSQRTLLWFRGKDLRVSDHAPLTSALGTGELVPLFVLDPYFFALERARELPHRMQFLRESLEALAKNIAHLGSELLLVAGKSVDVVPRLARELRVTRVVAQRWTEPFGRERDRRVAAELSVPLELFEGETLMPDAQPYFRVFNPTLQGEKFDPSGDYVRRYVPELAQLPAKFIHRPHEAPQKALEAAGVTLGVTYPEPIVDHALGRDRFLKIAESHLER
jgi:deoxyribodipyrimidine photolyase